MPKALELRKVIKVLNDYNVKFEPKSGGKHSGRFVKENKSYPVKTHGMKTMIMPYALKWLIKKFNLPSDIFG